MKDERESFLERKDIMFDILDRRSRCNQMLHRLSSLELDKSAIARIPESS
jgi:hypothetical protein